MVALTDATAEVKSTLEGLPEAQKKALVREVLEANSSWIQTSNKAKLILWLNLIVGVLIVAVVAMVIALQMTSMDADATAAWVVATAALTGIFGLFAKSPTA